VIEALLSKQYVIAHGHDVPTLALGFWLAIGQKPEGRLCHFKPVNGKPYSIRIFGQNPFENSIPLWKPMSSTELAAYLMATSHTERPLDQARYEERGSDPSGRKGWTISRSVDIVDEKGCPLVVAYAAWIDV